MWRHNFGPCARKKFQALSEEVEGNTPREIIARAVQEFGEQVAMSSSFQTQSVPLLHMVSQISPEMRIFFINTRRHFWETLMFRERLQAELNLNVMDLYPAPNLKNFVQ